MVPFESLKFSEHAVVLLRAAALSWPACLSSCELWCTCQQVRAHTHTHTLTITPSPVSFCNIFPLQVDFSLLLPAYNFHLGQWQARSGARASGILR